MNFKYPMLKLSLPILVRADHVKDVRFQINKLDS